MLRNIFMASMSLFTSCLLFICLCLRSFDLLAPIVWIELPLFIINTVFAVYWLSRIVGNKVD